MNRRGTTIVEVVLAALILAIMAIGGAAYMLQGRLVVGVQRNKRVALEAANAKLEEMRATSYGYANINSSFDTVSINGYPGLPNNRVWTVSVVNLPGGVSCKDVAVSVNYGAPAPVKLETFIAP